MASKTDVQVLLGGKVYTLSGYESEEYLQKIALYINNKSLISCRDISGWAAICRRLCWS